MLGNDAVIGHPPEDFGAVNAGIEVSSQLVNTPATSVLGGNESIIAVKDGGGNGNRK